MIYLFQKGEVMYKELINKDVEVIVSKNFIVSCIVKQVYMKKCPNCNNKLVEIVYGLPTVELMEKALKKEVSLGGCIIIGDMPRYHCLKCNKKYYEDLKESKDIKSNILNQSTKCRQFIKKTLEP